MIKVIMYILTITLFCKNGANSQLESEENCETLQSEIHIAKGELKIYFLKKCCA